MHGSAMAALRRSGSSSCTTIAASACGVAVVFAWMGGAVVLAPLVVVVVDRLLAESSSEPPHALRTSATATAATVRCLTMAPVWTVTARSHEKPDDPRRYPGEVAVR